MGEDEGTEQLGRLDNRRDAYEAPIEAIAVGALRGAVGVRDRRQRSLRGIQVCLAGGGERHAARMATKVGRRAAVEMGDRLRGAGLGLELPAAE